MNKIFIVYAERLIPIWIKIGKQNPIIRWGRRRSFSIDYENACKDINDLKSTLEWKAQAIGATCFFHNLCFIKQSDTTCEWLGIKNEQPFGHFNMEQYTGEKDFEDFVYKLISHDNPSYILNHH